MNPTRRQFLRRSTAATAGFLALRRALATPALALSEAASRSYGYGKLVADPEGLFDLPEGFSYQIISRVGDEMADGLVVPHHPDGMASFPGPDGLTLVVRNHELHPFEGPGPFGSSESLLEKIDRTKLYDLGGGVPHRGGTTTLVYDTNSKKLVRQFLSLGGTTRNCAGGPTPWKSWITCEETVIRTGPGQDGDYESEVDHGYCFEVPATADVQLQQAVPLKEMGRFNHEAVAVEPESGVVYLTEDRDDGLFYRYLPNKPGRLAAGGRLQALAAAGSESLDTRRWNKKTRGEVEIGARFDVQWMDLDEIESPLDDLRIRAFDAGAARFARGEGIWHADRQVFFACTSGGIKKTGQIWRYVPSPREGQADELSKPGSLELFLEPNDSRLLENADNLTVAPWGDVIVCEDRDGPQVRLVGVSPAGTIYTLADCHARSELAGVCFSPDGSTLFVNIQYRGLTLAVTGPWQGGA